MTSVGRVWRAEGTRAVRDRLWDRVRDARWRAASWRSLGEPWPSTPVVNVIGVPMTTQHGGVPRQLRARLRREAATRPIALLSPDPRADSLRLDTWIGDGQHHRVARFPRGAWRGDPLVEDPQWVETVRTCCQLVRAHGVHVENVAGLSLASLVRLADADEGVPVALTAHDFALFCRRPHLWESCGRFCEFSTDAERCHACLTAATAADGFTIDQPAHRALSGTLVASVGAIVVPSPFMRDRLSTLFPSIDPRRLHVIAPGIELPAEGLTSSARDARQVAIVGGPQDHKGGARLPTLATALAARGVDVTIYGGYGHEHLLALRQVRRREGRVRVRGYFCAGTLPLLLARQRAAVAIAVSQVPESFSLVLSEAWAAGVPMIAPAIGAFRDRLADGGGQLVSAMASDAEIVDAVDRLRRDPRVSVPMPPTAADAAEAHQALYRACRLMTSS
jgi:glycosyltransferase involved in cell wall biosynthesis